MSKTKLPAILLANDLLDGEVIFWTGTGWSPDLRDAFIARDEETERILETTAANEFRKQKIVEAYLTEVQIDNRDRPIPCHYREKIKTEGPSVRPDLGKQAGLYNLQSGT